MSYPKIVEQLIEYFVRFPGVGRRSAERMVLWLLDRPKDDADQFARAITELKERMRFCPQCNNLTDEDQCRVCKDVRRDTKILCVVESPKDLIAIERTGAFKGIYYVLLGSICPAEGRGPEKLNVEGLKARIQQAGVTEVIIATDPDTEGEMTALHLTEELKGMGLRLSRIGMGLPVGSSVEYVDHSTLTMSMNARREIAA